MSLTKPVTTAWFIPYSTDLATLLMSLNTPGHSVNAWNRVGGMVIWGNVDPGDCSCTELTRQRGVSMPVAVIAWKPVHLTTLHGDPAVIQAVLQHRQMALSSDRQHICKGKMVCHLSVEWNRAPMIFGGLGLFWISKWEDFCFISSLLKKLGRPTGAKCISSHEGHAEIWGLE